VLQYGFPGQYTAKWDVQETLWSGMLDIYRDAYAEVNLHFVTEFLENPLDLCSSKKFDGLASLKGAKIRAGGAYGDMLKELAGASVVMMPGGDIYTSMATGVIDGFVFGDILTAKIFGLLETCQYAVSPTLYGGHGGGCFFVNMDTWNELPEDVKLLIDLGVNNYAKDFTLYFQPGWQVKQEFVNDMGGELVPFPAADIAKINEWTFKKMDELAAQDPKFTAPAVELMKSIMANR
jgi:TRAP-type mannitol/chloroaromatic compound transport system substrate-binding protein